MDAPQVQAVDVPAVRAEPRSNFVESLHRYGGYRFFHVGNGVFQFHSRSSDAVYTLDINQPERPCSCWVGGRASSVAVCPHIRVLQAFLKKQKEKP